MIGRTFLHLVVLAAFGVAPALGADSCPAGLRTQADLEVKSGGVFYAARDGEFARLASGQPDFAGSRLQLFFVPRADLCGTEGEPNRIDCGERGFLLVKMLRQNDGVADDGSVFLKQGEELAKETNFNARFPQRAVTLEEYQDFHRDEVPRISVIRDVWHQKMKVGGEERATYRPLAKRLQFLFREGDDAKGVRTALLLRFRTPNADEVVCVPFALTLRETGERLHLDVMMTDPEPQDDEGFTPRGFDLARGG